MQFVCICSWIYHTLFYKIITKERDKIVGIVGLGPYQFLPGFTCLIWVGQGCLRSQIWTGQVQDLVFCIQLTH